MILREKPKKYFGKNVVEAFVLQTERLGDRPLVRYREDGIYVSKSWKEMKHEVDAIAAYLTGAGIRKGDRVAIYSYNCWQWWVADLAVLSVGGVTVPIYATNSAEETRYVLDHSGARICFTGNTEQLAAVKSVKDKLRGLKTIITFFDNPKKTGIISYSAAAATGRKNKKIKDVDRRRASIKGDDLLSIVYTSGTTGNPKGVMLTHGNIFSDVEQMLDVFGPYLDEDEQFFSFLPLSHVLERTAGYYVPIVIGCCVAFAESLKTISSDMQEIQPTVVLSVPRLFEKIHAGVLSTVAGFSPMKRAVVRWALNAGKRNVTNICENRPPRGFFAKKLSFYDAHVFSLLRKETGFGRAKIVISGGGPLSFSDADFFLSIGISLFEGYGLTETAPVTNVNPVGRIKPGSVGPSLPRTSISLSDEGEILVKGPQVMKGYYKDAAATKAAFDRKKRFHTGDIGRIDDDDYLYITGRIKDIIVTAGGKNISPQNIELALKQSPYIEQIAIVGDRRKFLSALIIPEMQELEKWAKKRGIFAADRKEMVRHHEVKKLFSREIESKTKDFARVERIRSFVLLDDIWGIDTGELTPSLKVKRRVIETKYANLIEAIYREPHS